jgi:predicted nucleic acid-binding protein
MRVCVLDCCVAVKIWLNEPESTAILDWLAREAAMSPEERIQCQVPELFYAEIANVLWKKATRTRTLPPMDVLPAIQDLEQISLFISNPIRPLIARSTDLALRYVDLAVYDACYLALAELYDCQLITDDQKMLDLLTDTPHAQHVMALPDFLHTVS